MAVPVPPPDIDLSSFTTPAKPAATKKPTTTKAKRVDAAKPAAFAMTPEHLAQARAKMAARRTTKASPVPTPATAAKVTGAFTTTRGKENPEPAKTPRATPSASAATPLRDRTNTPEAGLGHVDAIKSRALRMAASRKTDVEAQVAKSRAKSTVQPAEPESVASPERAQETSRATTVKMAITKLEGDISQLRAIIAKDDTIPAKKDELNKRIENKTAEIEALKLKFEVLQAIIDTETPIESHTRIEKPEPPKKPETTTSTTVISKKVTVIGQTTTEEVIQKVVTTTTDPNMVPVEVKRNLLIRMMIAVKKAIAIPFEKIGSAFSKFYHRKEIAAAKAKAVRLETEEQANQTKIRISVRSDLKATKQLLSKILEKKANKARKDEEIRAANERLTTTTREETAFAQRGRFSRLKKPEITSEQRRQELTTLRNEYAAMTKDINKGQRIALTHLSNAIVWNQRLPKAKQLDDPLLYLND